MSDLLTQKNAVTEQKMEKLDRLEGKITLAIEKVVLLQTTCNELTATNAQLTRDIEKLRGDNEDLNNRIVEAESVVRDGAGEKQVLNKIDRMLEKFGELQI